MAVVWPARILFLLAALVALALATPQPHAQASAHPARSTSIAALKWAETQAGCWYTYGGTSCSEGYDCSGLVQAAFDHEGYSLPRTTEEMQASGRIYQIAASQRRQGDLVFWGDPAYHVMFVTRHGTFGAQQTGTQVGWQPLWGAPTFWRIR